MAGRGVPAGGAAAAAAGALLIWSGVKGASVTTALRQLISGQSPAAPAFKVEGSLGPLPSKQERGNSPLPLPGDTGAHGSRARANQTLGRLLAARYGWSAGAQWQDLVSLWNRESGWNNFARNPSSGAYGIAQALPPTKYPPAGQASGGSSAAAQIRWGLAYIKSRYGSPSAAWAHEQSIGWY